MHLLRPALIYGGYGTRDYLRQLGFDTWDWFINWQWDQMPDGPQRLDLFQQELRRLLATPISQLVDLVDSNWSRLLHNRQRLEYIIKNYKDVAFLK